VRFRAPLPDAGADLRDAAQPGLLNTYIAPIPVLATVLNLPVCTLVPVSFPEHLRTENAAMDRRLHTAGRAPWRGSRRQGRAGVSLPGYRQRLTSSARAGAEFEPEYAHRQAGGHHLYQGEFTSRGGRSFRPRLIVAIKAGGGRVLIALFQVVGGPRGWSERLPSLDKVCATDHRLRHGARAHREPEAMGGVDVALVDPHAPSREAALVFVAAGAKPQVSAPPRVVGQRLVRRCRHRHGPTSRIEMLRDALCRFRHCVHILVPLVTRIADGVGAHRARTGPQRHRLVAQEYMPPVADDPHHARRRRVGVCTRWPSASIANLSPHMTGTCFSANTGGTLRKSAATTST
jgi:hypothetical protein